MTQHRGTVFLTEERLDIGRESNGFTVAVRGHRWPPFLVTLASRTELDGPLLRCDNRTVAPLPADASAYTRLLARTRSLPLATHHLHRSLVPMTQESAHLDSAHRDTLSHLFQHPASYNIEWHDVLSLLEAVGSVEERHDGRFVVTVGSETLTLEQPRDKDIDIQQLVDIRRVLRNAGYASDLE